MWRLPKLNIDPLRFQQWAQGTFAIAGILAIGVGGALYYWERRDKPRIVLQPRATVIKMKSGSQSKATQSVLLHFSVAIENRGSLGLVFNCAAIDILGLSGMEPRQPTYHDDLAGQSLLIPNPSDPSWAGCRDRFESKRRRDEARLRVRRERSDEWINPPLSSPKPTTGARYRDFFMEPGEVATKTWEQRIPCSFDAVRVIFKLPKPKSTHDYETKIVVPIADVCRDDRNVVIHNYAPVVPGTEEDAAAETPPKEEIVAGKG